MKCRRILLIAILFLAITSTSAPASSDPLFKTVMKTVNNSIWVATHPGQSLDPQNWHRECVTIAGCIRVPGPLG
jgi:hypothetical protein